MPNHIITEVRIAGKEKAIRKLIEETKIILDSELPEGDNKFDFNGIIKRPEELNNTVSPITILKTEEEAKAENELYNKQMKDHYGGHIQVKAISEATNKDWLERFGANNWYDWSYANWGTKWNAYDVHYTDSKFDGDDSYLVIQISIAWDTPHDIWAKLEEMGFEVDGVYYGEMDGYLLINKGDEYFDIYQNVDVVYRG